MPKDGTIHHCHKPLALGHDELPQRSAMTIHSTRPTRRRSPADRCAFSTRLLLTNVPFVLVRSTTSRLSSVAVSRQCRRETRAAWTTKSARGARPTVLTAPDRRRNVVSVSAFRRIHIDAYLNSPW